MRNEGYYEKLPRKIRIAGPCQCSRLDMDGNRCPTRATWELTYHGDGEYGGPGDHEDQVGWVVIDLCEKHARSHCYDIDKLIRRKKNYEAISHSK